MIDMSVIISLAVFVVALLLYGGLLYVLQHAMERRKMTERLKGEAGMPEVDEVAGGTSFLQRARYRTLKFMRVTGNRVVPKKARGDLPNLEMKFLQAGYRNKNVVPVYWGAKALFAVILPAMCLLAKIALFPRHTGAAVLIAIVVALAVIGYCLPEMWLRMKLRARKEKILEGFPDALDLMVVCVEAGMSLDTAIYRVGEEMKLDNKVISDELKLTNLELRAGKSRRDALKSFSMRADIDDVYGLVNLLIQTDRFGTSIADALRSHADFMRQKRYQRAEEAAMKIPVKILFPMVFFVFPTIFIIILGPPFIRAFRMWTAAH